MKHLFFLCLVAIAINTDSIYAQRSTKLPHNKGELELAAGLGVISSQIIDGDQNSPPLQIGIDFRTNKKFSIGMCFSKTSTTDREVAFRNDAWLIAMRPLMHFTRHEKLDIYGGLMLGYLNESIAPLNPAEALRMSNFNIKSHNNKILYSALIGAKYRIGKRFNLFSEAGYGLSLLTAGASIVIRK